MHRAVYLLLAKSMIQADSLESSNELGIAVMTKSPELHAPTVSKQTHKHHCHACAGLISRRQFGTAALAAAGLAFLPQMAFSQDAPVRNLVGKLDIDGFKKQTNGSTRFQVKAEDTQTAFSIGGDAFLANDKFVAEFEVSQTGVVAGLAITAGQVLSVFKPITGRETALETPNASASIRGTGCFVDVETDAPKTYLCCCYGEVAVQNSTTGEAQILKNAYHTARFITPEGNFAAVPYDAPLNHYDDQLVSLEAAVGREPHWQLPGGKMVFFAPSSLPF